MLDGVCVVWARIATSCVMVAGREAKERARTFFFVQRAKRVESREGSAELLLLLLGLLLGLPRLSLEGLELLLPEAVVGLSDGWIFGRVHNERELRCSGLPDEIKIAAIKSPGRCE